MASRRRRLLGSVLIACSLVVIVHSTLSPYQFDFSSAGVAVAQTRLAQLLQKPLVNRAFWVDVCRNILFFLPLGFGLGCRLLGNLPAAADKSSGRNSSQKTFSFRTASGHFLAVSFCLSAGVELAQLFEPSRHASFFDLLCNTTGGVVGGWLLVYALQWHRQWRWGLSSAPVRAAIALSLLIFLLYVPHRSTSLQSWKETYQLVVGNEVSGNRPWRGEITQFSLSARAASAQEISAFFKGNAPIRSVIASYRFDRNAADSAVVVRSPSSAPPLSWQGSLATDSRSTGLFTDKPIKAQKEQSQSVSIGPKSWLITDTAPTGLISALKQNSAFTLTARITSAKVKQFGPARIVSLSNGTSDRNFTLAQDGTRLVFRLATAWTGQDGTWPEFAVPDVFLPGSLVPRSIVVTYRNPQLTIYVDDITQVHWLSLSPRQNWLWTGLALFRPAQQNYWQVESETPDLFQLARILYWSICLLVAVWLVHAFICSLSLFWPRRIGF